MVAKLTLRGVDVYKGWLDGAAQADLVGALREVITQAPLFSPDTPYGKPMTVRMSAAGKYGWFSDRRGYRYEDRHPTGALWPAIPEAVLAIWRDLVSAARLPDCCLINFYGEGARMGMHQDKDEANFDWPVLSFYEIYRLLFRVGNTTRGGQSESVWLSSGDVVVTGGAARLSYHGVDRIRFGSSSLLPRCGRINLTCRVVD